MDYEHDDGRLTVRMTHDFNWPAAQRIAALAEDANHVVIDLADVRLLDSEALVLLDRLQRAGKTVQVREPPPLFYELIDVLELHPIFDVDAMVE